LPNEPERREAVVRREGRVMFTGIVSEPAAELVGIVSVPLLPGET
jgi:hypothetical protein